MATDFPQTYQVEIGQHIAAVERDGGLLADAAQAAGLTASVPACPGWQVRDLVRHQAYVHGWAARHIAEQAAEIIGTAGEADILSGGLPDADLIASYREGVAALVRTLRAADPDVACATFLPAPSPLAFWARRQAHETAIHRFDAQAAGRAAGRAADPLTAFAPAFAADGIDELITGFAARRKRPAPACRCSSGPPIRLMPGITSGRPTARCERGASAWKARTPCSRAPGLAARGTVARRPQIAS